MVIFTGGSIQLLLLVKSRQILNKPCLRTSYDPVTEYTKTTLALKQFSTGPVGEADNYRTEKIKAGNRNTVPYNYTVEVTNRFKGLDLIECLNKYGQRFVTLYRRR